jgi:hypothetical protein
MEEVFEFDSLEADPFLGEFSGEYLGEFEEEMGRRRGGMPRRVMAKRRQAAARWPFPRRANPLARPPWKRWPPRPRPPFGVPGAGGGVPAGPTTGQPQMTGGTGTSEPCPPCNCPSCADQPAANQPAADQPASDQPTATTAGPSQAPGAPPSPDQTPPTGDPAGEFFYQPNGYGLRSEYETWQSEMGAVAGAIADPRIIDLTARATKKWKHMRKPSQVDTLVLHQMACCYQVKDPLTRFLNIAPHFAILPDGRILQIHPLLLWTGASNGFNDRSVAVEFAGNFPNYKGKWWQDRKEMAAIRERLRKRGVSEPKINAHLQAYVKANENQVTPQQIESGRYLVRYLIQKMGLKKIVAHRQSSITRENDPGPDIWSQVGQWATQNLGLSDGGPGYKIGKGFAIPDLWRTWGQAKPQPELEFGNYETQEWEASLAPAVSRGGGASTYVRDFSGPTAECTASLARAGKTKAQALSIINAHVHTAILLLRRASASLKRGSRVADTRTIFRQIFRVDPEFVPTWLRPTATIKDRGDVVAMRCRRVADLLASGRIKFFCSITAANCPDCGNDSSPFACSSYGKDIVICLGNGFWDDMKAGRNNSLLSTLMHEPFHIYYGRHVTQHDPKRGKFGGINCIVQFVFAKNRRTVPSRVRQRCSAMAVRREMEMGSY